MSSFPSVSSSNGTTKTLLLLGGSRQQVVAIERAKALGYRTVLCDYLPDNPGQHHADSFHLVSTTNKEAVLEIACREAVSGVLAYASDPASPTAAYVAEALGLPTNPPKSIEIMCSKDLFRQHLEKYGFSSPSYVAFSATCPLKDILTIVEELTYPIVIKPTDSSGSKGVNVVRSSGEVVNAISHAKEFTKNGILIAEEYIERKYPHVIGGDIFVLNGEVVFWGLMACIRDSKDSLVPNGKMIPSGLSYAQYASVKEVLQRLVTSLDIKFGELNVEVLIGAKGIPYVLELGGRAGGNMIPVQLSDASDIDLVAANVLCAMGDDPGAISWESDGCCFATYVLHSRESGVYDGYELSKEVQACLYREEMYCDRGNEVECFDAANKALGILFFKFEDEAHMNTIMSNASDHIRVKVRES